MSVNPKTELVVAPYKPATPPSTADSQAIYTYLLRELQNLTRTLSGLLDAGTQATDVAPKNPRNGMIRYAEGAWGTALGGNGFYGYKNGVWTHII